MSDLDLTGDLPQTLDWLQPGSGLIEYEPAPRSAETVLHYDSSHVIVGQKIEGEAKRIRLPVLQTAAPKSPSSKPSTPSSKKKTKKKIGSGIPARRIIVLARNARRVSQAFFLGLFVYWLTQTTFRGDFASDATSAIRLNQPVEGFLLANPYLALVTLFSTHALYAGLAYSLSVLLLTLVFGRAFCGWICPFGTLHHLLSFVSPSALLKGATRVRKNQYSPYQRVKFFLLIFFLAAALTGSALGGLFDPICIAVRGIGLGVLPALQYIATRFFDFLTATNLPVLQQVSDSAQSFLGSEVWAPEQPHFHQTWLILVVFVALLALNRVIPRFWCRALCPLGALLGFFSRFAFFGMEKDHSKCTDCNLCMVNCQGGDNPQGGVKHEQQECHLCFNCEPACPEDVIKFKFFPGLRSRQLTTDLDKRSSLAIAAAGAMIVPATRISNWPDKAYSEKVIRPPGSVEEREFLERCIRCAECMKVCPNNAVHPAFTEAGPEGIWTPIIIPRMGYCEQSCVLCGQVCPTGAIEKIDESDKLGIGKPAISIGTAFFDRGRCLPWAMATPCTVCEEFCPTSPKAIWVEEVMVPKRGQVAQAGVELAPEMVKVKRPHLDPELCIGCGACEKVCPVVDKPAVYITSAGETRSKTNVILLEDSAYS